MERCDDRWAGTHKPKAGWTVLTASNKCLMGTFWQLSKSLNLLTSLYHRIYLLTCKSVEISSLPWWGLLGCKDIVELAHRATSPAYNRETREEGWPQEGGSKENNGTHLLSARLTITWKMILRWRRVWEDSAIDQNKGNGEMRQIFPLEKKALVQKKTRDYLVHGWIILT